ncbi:MAG: hypothetical protein M1823_003357 [Watsoniomyces obsoletus]|nr:MAG: hypothetical protein M1823_003357 [Watsoniomyces obsoletus]
MNFAALLSKEIEKAKPAGTSDSTSAQNDKYIKRSELEKQRQAAYLAEQQAAKTAKEEASRKKRKFEEEEAERNRVREEKRARLAEESRKRREEEEARLEKARRKRLGLPELPPKKEDTSTSENDEIPDDADLDAKLRKLNQPVRLFGESNKQRFRRYQRLTAKSASGFTSLELVPEEDMKVTRVPKDPQGRKYLYRQLATYFTVVLREWEIALNARPADVKDSFQGKAATNAFLQSRENMKPLFRKFEKGELDTLDAVVEIVQATQERRYVDANDAYLRLSIGKA